MDKTKYPIGTQSFSMLREMGCVYADKTGYVYDLAHSGGRIFFLSRPRRFGKSLLLSTIEAYFRGQRQLFDGLAISVLESDWESYPVLRFDFSACSAYEPRYLCDYIRNSVKRYRKQYGIDTEPIPEDVADAFSQLIADVGNATGKKVVVLIDEYDKGIIEVLDRQDQLQANQNILRSFYSQLKVQDDHIRFAMLTGVSRFRHLTIFSGFNNPNDISLDTKYAAICGITKQEMAEVFADGINALAAQLGKTYDDTVETLRLKYDGYRFSASNEMVFNPFSIINCLEKQVVGNYWIKSGTSKIFVDYITKTNFDITTLEDLWVSAERMEAPYSETDPIPLLFQTGYLTISDTIDTIYRLSIPNGEVRNALVYDLAPIYMGVSADTLPVHLMKLKMMVNTANIDGFLTILQSMVAKVPYQELNLPSIEKTYHLIIYQIFLMMGIDTRSEIAMSGGSIDMVAQTSKYVYVMEFKLGSTAHKALSQIDQKGYAIPWRADGREVFKIGVNFSPTTRTIDEWAVSK